MYLAEEIQKKWAPVLDHEALGAIKDQNRRSVTADRKSTRLNSSHMSESRMPSSA